MDNNDSICIVQNIEYTSKNKNKFILSYIIIYKDKTFTEYQRNRNTSCSIQHNINITYLGTI